MMEPQVGRGQRVIIGVVYPALLVAGMVVPYLWWRDGLPSPIAVHFDMSGHANGSASVSAHLVIGSLFTFAAAVVLVSAARQAWPAPAACVAVAAFVGWLASSLNIVVLAANHGHDRWQGVTLGPGAIWGTTLGALGAAIPVALLARRGAQPASPALAPQLRLATTERAAWFGHTNSRAMAASVVVLVAVGTILLLITPSRAALAGLTFFATGLAMAAFATVDVAVGEDGLRVRTGLGWPQLAIPLTDIRSACVVEWQPLRGPVVSGWGYRGSLRLMGRAGWVVRGGPALQLDLTHGRQFIVTTDAADEAASVLNGLLARPTSAGIAE